MLLMLAPPGLSRPSPLEMRCSMTVASSGWLATRSRRAFFSHQRKLGMPSLLPCRMPAWLAGVVEGSSASQWPSLWVPDRIQLDISGTRPARTEWLMTSWERPSTWMMTRPGCVGPGDVRPAAGHRPHERAVVRIVLAEAEERRHGGLQEAEDERDDQQADEARAHGDVRDERVEQPEDEGLEQQREQDERDHRPAGDETDEDRPHEQVQRRDEDHGRQAASQALDLQRAGQQPGGDVEGDEGGEQRDQGTLEERHRGLGASATAARTACGRD